MSVGYRIKALRIQKGMSQEELGAMVGVQKAAINKYESEIVVNIKRAMIEKLARALEVSPAYLMCYDINEKTAAPKGDGLSPLEAQLMGYIQRLTDDQKKMLLAQIELLLKNQG